MKTPTTIAVDYTNAEEVYELLSRYINSSASRDSSAFLEAFSRDHRTLQQKIVGLFLCVIEQQAQNKFYDLRSKASVEICKELIDTFQKNNNDILPHEVLPFI